MEKLIAQRRAPWTMKDVAACARGIAWLAVELSKRTFEELERRGRRRAVVRRNEHPAAPTIDVLHLPIKAWRQRTEITEIK